MKKTLAERIRGVVFGQAVGDALGFGTEFLSRGDVRVLYPEGLRSYAQITRFQACEQWQPGDWTDDTDQMLCILDSLLACQKLDLADIARRLHHWAVTDGFAMGSTVYSVVHHPQFLSQPQQVAEAYWESTCREAAANGGVMRTAVLGVWDHPQEERIRHNAEQVCKLTHADPRCVGSCVAVCLAISRLLSGADDMRALLREVAAEVRGYHPDVEMFLNLVEDVPLEAVDLDEGMNPGEKNRQGYTLKTLGAGFWALRHADSFAAGIEAVIHEGGDADTNAAVAGALLGARFGYQGIEPAWREGLLHRLQLAERVDRLLELCAET
jgi:ADP-ribosylglycohydrolase